MSTFARSAVGILLGLLWVAQTLAQIAPPPREEAPPPPPQLTRLPELIHFEEASYPAEALADGNQGLVDVALVLGLHGGDVLVPLVCGGHGVRDGR